MKTQQSKLLLDWLKTGVFTVEDRQMVLNWDLATQNQRFSRTIKMNSSGWRRPLGLGSDSFNLYTIKQIAAAWFDLLKQTHRTGKVLIFADHRHLSQAAKALCAALGNQRGFTVYTTSQRQQFAPTPFLTYLLKHFDFIGGMMITASHCPANYNGCKLFDAAGIGINGSDLTLFHNFLTTNALKYLKLPVKYHAPLILESYYQTHYFQSQATFLDQFAKTPKVIPLFFSALHGTAANWTDVFLRQRKFPVTIVESQHDFNPDFPTLKELNPEDDQVFALLRTTAAKPPPRIGTLLIAQDCDGDRMRAAVQTPQGWKFFHGNEIATIICYFYLHELKWTGTIYRSWVSTPLIDQIGQHFSQPVVVTETGPTNLALAYSQTPESFLFAFEESLGYLPSLTVNSYKDGIFSALTIAEIANYLMVTKKLSLDAYLVKITNQFAVYSYLQMRFFLKAKDITFPTLKSEVETWKTVGKHQITAFKFLPSYKECRLLILELGTKAWIGFRLSKTEPLIKVYFTAASKDQTTAAGITADLARNFREKIVKWEKYAQL